MGQKGNISEPVAYLLSVNWVSVRLLLQLLLILLQ